jgi:DNA ligase-1
MAARDLNKREFLMLAGTFDPEVNDPTGWYMSEKLDGMRCFWDGGISIGLPAGVVPYANTAVSGGEHISTGLWSRGGKVIHAPAWFTEDLPRNLFLDGELWNQGTSLQDIVSITRAHSKDEEWAKLYYKVFDNPSPNQFLRAGRVHILDWEAQLPNMAEWAQNRCKDLVFIERPFSVFVKNFVEKEWYGNYWSVHRQTLAKDTQDVYKFLDNVIMGDGEGVMLRRAESVWNPRRAREDLLKVKKFYDAEAVIVGFTSGKITKKNSRLRGKLGALIVEEVGTGHRFEVAGLNDSERGLEAEKKGGDQKNKAVQYAWDHPGEALPEWITPVIFEVGQKITFKYWDRTKDGIPKFAVYHRPRLDE